MSPFAIIGMETFCLTLLEYCRIQLLVEQTGAGEAMDGQSLNTTIFSQLGNLYTQLRCSGAQPVRECESQNCVHCVYDPDNYRLHTKSGTGAEPASLRFTFFAGHPY